MCPAPATAASRAAASCAASSAVSTTRRSTALRATGRQLLRALHRRLDRVEEGGANACPLELPDRADRRAAGGGDHLAELHRMHLLVAQELRRPEHRLDDELRRDLAAEPE